MIFEKNVIYYNLFLSKSNFFTTSQKRILPKISFSGNAFPQLLAIFL